MLIVLCASFLFISAPATASSLQLQYSIIMREVVAGERFTHSFVLKNTGRDTVDVSIEVAGLGQNTHGSYIPLVAANDGLNSAVRFITRIDEDSFSLTPADEQTVVVTFRIPETIPAGGYYALIYVQSRLSGTTSAAANLGCNIPVVLTVDGEMRRTGVISDLATAISERTLQIATEFSNTGNYHYKAANRVTVSDKEGAVIATGGQPLTSSSIVPGNKRIFRADFMKCDQGMKNASQVLSEIVNQDGVVIASRVMEIETQCLPASEQALTLDRYYALFSTYAFSGRYIR